MLWAIARPRQGRMGRGAHTANLCQARNAYQIIHEVFRYLSPFPLASPLPPTSGVGGGGLGWRFSPRTRYCLPYVARFGVLPNVTVQTPPPSGGRLGGGRDSKFQPYQDSPSPQPPPAGRGSERLLPNKRCGPPHIWSDPGAARYVIYARNVGITWNFFLSP